MRRKHHYQFEMESLPADFLKRIDKLVKLMQFIQRASPKARSSGRIASKRIYAIYWPHILLHASRVDWLCAWAFGGTNAIVKRATRAGFKLSELPPVGIARQQWKLERVREYLEHEILGPLLLDGKDPYVKNDVLTYAYRLPEEQQDAAKDPRAHHLLDLANYTVFRFIEPKRVCLARVFYPPPPWPEVAEWFKELPEPLRLLYEAWFTLRTRSPSTTTNESPPIETQGLAFSRQGYVFVNWKRYWGTRTGTIAQATGDVAILPDDIAQALYNLKHWPVRNAMAYPVDTRIVYGAVSTPGYRFAQVNPYVRECREISIGDFADPEKSDACTFFDPLSLYDRPDAFNGYRYYREKRQISAKAQRARIRRQMGVVPKLLPTVYEFTFTPAKYLPALRSRGVPDFTPWFPIDHHEPIYAVKRDKQLCFTNPTLMRKSNPDCVGDIDVWTRGLDELNCIEHFQEDGTIGNVQDRLRSDFYKQMRRDKLNTVLPHLFKGYASIDELSRRKLRKVNLKAGEEYLKQHPELERTIEPKNWERAARTDLAKRWVPRNAVRRVLDVVLPTGPDPVQKYFYTSQSVLWFERAALASFGFLPDDVSSSVMDNIYTFAVSAPYLYAWTQFCKEMQERGPSAAVAKVSTRTTRATDDRPENEASGSDRWIPAEDYVLLRGYRLYPRMSAKEKKALLDALPRRSMNDILSRRMRLRRLLHKLLTPKRFEEHAPGRIACTDTAARRATILIGCAMTAQHLNHKLHSMHPVIAEIFKFDARALTEMEFPPSYTVEFYARYFLDRYV